MINPEIRFALDKFADKKTNNYHKSEARFHEKGQLQFF
jgi:hypothetical protein